MELTDLPVSAHIHIAAIENVSGLSTYARYASGFEMDFRQTNFEGELIEAVHAARREACGIIINPAGWTPAMNGYRLCGTEP